jgi:hypothetical protein
MRDEIAITFTSDRFADAGPVRADANAGNRLPGEDVANALAAALSARAMVVIDEDWGWLVATRRDAPEPFARRIEWVGVYGEGDGTWTLRLSCRERRRVLGLLAAWRPCAPPADFIAAVETALAGLGARAIARE